MSTSQLFIVFIIGCNNYGNSEDTKTAVGNNENPENEAFLMKLTLRIREAFPGERATAVVQSLEEATQSFAGYAQQAGNVSNPEQFLEELGETLQTKLGGAAEPFQHILHETWQEHLRSVGFPAVGRDDSDKQ